MNYYSGRLLLRPVLKAVVLFITLALPSTAKCDEKIEAFRAAHSQWLANINFKSTYELRVIRGRKGLAEDAFDDGYFDAVEPARNGVFNKLGKLVRLSASYSDKPVVTDRGDGTFMSSNTTHDTVMGHEVLLTYREGYSSGVNTFADEAVFEKAWEKTGANRNCRLIENSINPIFPRGNCEYDPFEESTFHRGSATHITKQIDPSHLEVTSKSSVKGEDYSYLQTVKIIWKTDASIPVIEEIVQIIESDDGNVLGKNTIKLSNFEHCPGGLVAKRVVHVSSYDSSYDAIEWKSTDLGMTSPKDSDFIIEIPETTRVEGLREAPATGTVRKLDISQVSLDDLLKSGEAVFSKDLLHVPKPFEGPGFLGRWPPP